MNFDPRTKLIFVCLLTSLAVIKVDMISLAVITLLTFIISRIVKYNITKTLFKMKRLLSSFLIIFVLQCLFNKSGDPLINIGDFVFITTGGLSMGIQFVLRMFIIILCGGIISTSNSREIIQGLIQLKLPYELAFMVTIAISFIPMLGQEIQDAVVALNLRGVNLKNIPFKKKIDTFTYLFFPIIMEAIEKTKKLSISLELRGFRQKKLRTSRVYLHLNKRDYMAMSLSLMIFCVILYI